MECRAPSLQRTNPTAEQSTTEHVHTRMAWDGLWILAVSQTRSLRLVPQLITNQRGMLALNPTTLPISQSFAALRHGIAPRDRLHCPVHLRHIIE